jgi:hypothetical protein
MKDSCGCFIIRENPVKPLNFHPKIESNAFEVGASDNRVQEDRNSCDFVNVISREIKGGEVCVAFEGPDRFGI